MAYDLHANLPDGTATPGYEEWNEILQSIRAALFNPIPLGGSLDTGHPGSSYQRVVSGVPFVLPSAVEGGGVWKARVFLVCEDAAVTITPKIRNVTDGSDAVIGDACSGTAADWSGTNQQQTLTFTPTVGKVYELWATKSAETKECWLVGTLQRTDA
jgi:hypothetical protein